LTFLEEYANKVLNNEIIACIKIKKVYKHLLDKKNNPDKYFPWVFDEEKANLPIEFIETFCKQAQGETGSKLTLKLFQKAKHQAVFGFVHKSTGVRQYQEVLDIRARKNGKTTELAADSLFLMLADSEGSPEIYFIATKLEQSKKGFDEALKMVKQSPMLRKHIRKRQADMYCAMNFGTSKALASNSNSLDGLNGHGIIIDELAAIKNRDIYDLMKQSMSSRRQPLLTCITTNGFVRECIFDSQYEYASGVLDGNIIDDRFLAFIYELDDRDEWKDEKMWVKANPGLDTIKSRDFLRDCVEKAKTDPAFKPTVMVKDFNLKETAASAWLSWDMLENKEKFDFAKMNFSYGVGGFDAADSVDLNSAKALCMRPNDPKIYVKSMYWIPSDILNKMTTDGNRLERDAVPYLLWERQGFLRSWEGNKVDKICFLEWFRELRELENLYIYKIGYDPWHIDDSLLRQFKAEFGQGSMIPIRQGVATLSQPMTSMKADLKSKIIVYNDNPIDKWCLSNTEIKQDINANIQPFKSADRKKRIDGTISLLCGYIVLEDNKEDYSNMI